MKIVFVGAVEGSRIALDALIKAGLPPALSSLPRNGWIHSDYADLSTVAKSLTAQALRAKHNAPDYRCKRASTGLCRSGLVQISRRIRAIARYGNIGFIQPGHAFEDEAVIRGNPPIEARWVNTLLRMGTEPAQSCSNSISFAAA